MVRKVCVFVLGFSGRLLELKAIFLVNFFVAFLWIASLLVWNCTKAHFRSGAFSLHFWSGVGQLQFRSGVGQLHLKSGISHLHSRYGVGQLHFRYDDAQLYFRSECWSDSLHF